MSPRNLLLALSLAANVGLTYKLLTRPPAESPVPAVARREPQTVGPAPTDGPRPSPGATKAPTACAELPGAIAALDVLSFESKLVYPDAGGCPPSAPELEAVHREYQRACRGDDPEFSPNCHDAARRYQALLAHLATKDVPVSAISDVRLLSQKYLAFQGLPPHYEQDAQGLLQVGLRILELRPDRIEAVHIALDALRAQEGSAPDSLWATAKEVVAKGLTLEPQNPDLEEADLWVRTRGFDETRLKAEGARHVKTHPHSGLGYLVLGQAAWKDGDLDQAVEWIRAAIQREPREWRYRTALEALQKGREPGLFFGGAPTRFDALIGSGDSGR